MVPPSRDLDFDATLFEQHLIAGVPFGSGWAYHTPGPKIELGTMPETGYGGGTNLSLR